MTQVRLTQLLLVIIGLIQRKITWHARQGASAFSVERAI